jgi:hypothetical protein
VQRRVPETPAPAGVSFSQRDAAAHHRRDPNRGTLVVTIGRCLENQSITAGERCLPQASTKVD